MKLLLSIVLIWLLGIVGNAAVIQYVFSTTGSSVIENVAAQQICFTVKLTPAPAGQDAPSVTYSTTNGTAEGAATSVNDGHHDYKTVAAGTVSFASGFTSFGTGQNTYATKSVCTPVYDDTVYEGLSEYFNFNLSNPLPNASAGDSAVIVSGSESVQGLIIENDTTTLPQVSISDANGAENNGPFVFTVSLTQPVTTNVTMNYTTKSNTARDDTSPVGLADFNATSGTLTFLPGETTKTISVNIVNDNTVETLNERFNVELSNLSLNIAPYDISGEGTITDDDGVTSQYCSPYRGMISINEYHHMVTYKDIGTDHPVQLGNFIELKRDPLMLNTEFQPDNNWTIVVYTGTGGIAKTFTFAQRDTSCGVNTPYLIFNYDNYNLPATAVDVIVFDGQGKEVDFFSLNNPNYRESNCIAHPDATGASFPFDTDITLANAADKDIFREPDGTGDWTSNGSGANSGATRCWEPASLAFGILDAVDEDFTPTFNPYNGILRTKITNKSKNLKVISLNTAKTGYQNLTNVVVKAFRIDSDGSVSEVIGDIEFDGISSAPINNFSRNFAKKDSRILFQYCDVNGSVFGHYNECTANNGTLKSSASFDNFAIRPDRLDISATNYNWPNLLRAAEDYNTTIHAYQYGVTTDTVDYNVPNADLNFTIVTTKYDRNNAITPSMFGVATFASGGFDMANGVSVKTGLASNEVAGLGFSDVGKINIRLEDRIWAAVDNDDTPMNCDANGTYICGDANLTFIPHHFDFSALGITNNNGNPGIFTYLANEVDQMAGRIHTQIQALNKLNAVTANFSPSPLWENNVTVIPVVTKSTYLYPDANESNITNLPLGFSFGTKTIAWDESNTSQDLRFNFRRDINLPQNSFDVNGSDLNISMVSHYVDGIKIADINGSRLGSGVNNLPYTVVSPADGNSTFVYGRIIPRDIRVFGANISFTANGWYEVYNTSKLNGVSLQASKNESMWYINSLHSDVPTNYDGDANVTVVNTTVVNLGGAVGTDGIEDYIFPATYSLGGYKAHINTDPWLWYGVNALGYLDPNNLTNLDCMTHPCFNINIVPPTGATGSAKSTNETTKASKASGSGGGAWKSTTDYAPAIR